jgi:hypothetical protein
MLLIVTNGSDATADYLLPKLTEGNIPFVRFDTNTALERIALSFTPGNPLIRIDNRLYSPDDFSNVWYRRPERLLSSQIPDTPEGKCVLDEWSEGLEGFFAHIPRYRWMNFPAANALASRKLEQLTVAKYLGFTIPDTLVTQDSEALRAFFYKHDGEVIVKPIGRACVERSDSEVDSIIFTNRVREFDLENLEDLARCPTLFQQSVRKLSDVRITLVDGEIHTFELTAKDLDGKQRCDIRRNNMSDVVYREICPPQDIVACLHRLMKHYGLRFAAIDMAVADDGEWYFFEVNPNGQWAWLDLCAGATIYESFCKSFSADAKSSGDLS